MVNDRDGAVTFGHFKYVFVRTFLEEVKFNSTISSF